MPADVIVNQPVAAAMKSVVAEDVCKFVTSQICTPNGAHGPLKSWVYIVKHCLECGGDSA